MPKKGYNRAGRIQERHRYQMEEGFITTRLNEVLGWARKNSIFPYPFVTACCGMEFMSTAASRYDIERFGAGLTRFSPRQADVLFVVGTISHKMAPVLRLIYEQMCEPKWVVAFGVCTCTGGFYDNYATVQGIDTILPVDLYIPGCPPRPEMVLDGLLKLQKKIERGERAADPLPPLAADFSCSSIYRAPESGRADDNYAPDMEDVFLHVGPSHPSMHGVIRIRCRLQGETIRRADVDIGYLHRAFEKKSEQGNFFQVIPYTDRLNYVSPLINNFAYCGAVEKLMGLEIPERCGYIRVILSEISRICDHLTCVGASAMELGAMTAFLYMMKAREWLYDLVEESTGARITVSFGRIGGVKADLPEDFPWHCRSVIPKIREVNREVHKLLTRNRIFYDRTKDIGVLSRENAIAYGVTGPVLRSTGVEYDVRKHFPCWIYDRMHFDVPTGSVGDNYDRYLVRMEEMEQSLRILEQALAQMPAGAVAVDLDGKEMEPADMVDRAKQGQTQDLCYRPLNLEATLRGSEKARNRDILAADKAASLPPKEEVYGNIEGLMRHFKLIMDGHGIRPPAGEVYFPLEGANGELGFFVAADGTDRPLRIRVKAPCFAAMSALHLMLEGGGMADIVPTFGSINMIAGELDR